MTPTSFLVDTSVVARIHRPEVAARVDPLIERGLIAICDVVTIEIGHWATSIEHYERLRLRFEQLFTWVPTPDDVFADAQKIQARLVRTGGHRKIRIPDLCIAATARLHNLTVLHYDHDFELIGLAASVPEEWVVKRGSIS